MTITTTTREPLAPNPNGSRTFPLLRRKASNPSLPQISSSSTEIAPSAHPSIYEASAHPSADSLVFRNSLAKAADDLAWLQGIDPVHKPHRLDVITEKNSRSTLVTQRSVSVNGTGALSTSGASWADAGGKTQGKGVEGMAWLVGTKQPGILGTASSGTQNVLGDAVTTRRTAGNRRSHTNPLPKVKASRFSEVLSSSDTSLPPAYDTFRKLPHTAPPHRGSTPPGLPTFNTPAAQNYKLPRPPMRLRDYVKRESPRKEYKRQTYQLPPGVVMRGERGVLVRGKWRAGISGHLGGEMGRENLHYRSVGLQDGGARAIPEVREGTRSELRRILEGIRGICPCTGKSVDGEPGQPARIRSLRGGLMTVRVGRGRYGGEVEDGAAMNF